VQLAFSPVNGVDSAMVVGQGLDDGVGNTVKRLFRRLLGSNKTRRQGGDRLELPVNFWLLPRDKELMGTIVYEACPNGDRLNQLRM